MSRVVLKLGGRVAADSVGLALERHAAGDEVIVVHEGATFAATSLEPMIERHFRDGAAATVGMNPDGSPAGVYILRASQFPRGGSSRRGSRYPPIG